MVMSLEDLQKIGRDNVEATLKSLGACAKNTQAIADQVAAYSKKSLDEGAKTLEKLFGARSFDHALEIQNAYYKTSYDAFVSQASTLGSMYLDLAGETCKPFEGCAAKAAGAR